MDTGSLTRVPEVYWWSTFQEKCYSFVVSSFNCTHEGRWTSEAWRRAYGCSLAEEQVNKSFVCLFVFTWVGKLVFKLNISKTIAVMYATQKVVNRNPEKIQDQRSLDLSSYFNMHFSIVICHRLHIHILSSKGNIWNCRCNSLYQLFFSRP